MAVSLLMLVACSGAKSDISSPDGRTKLHFELSEAGEAAYSLKFDGEHGKLFIVLIYYTKFLQKNQ